MSNSDRSNSTAEMSELLQAELDGEFSSNPSDKDLALPVAGSERAPDPRDRLPRKVAGGFRGLSEDLHSRARDWRTIHRLLEQQRPLLEAAENERDRLLKELDRIVPEVRDACRDLGGSIATAHDGDLSGDLAQRFTLNLAALDELEDVAGSLNSNLLAIRSAWEQYARTAIRAHKMREELKSL